MNQSRSVTRTLALVLVVSGLTSTLLVSRVGAAVPSPASSTCPTTVTVTSDGSCCFDVIVRDAANNPVPNSTVNVDFGNCRVTLCPVQPPGVTIQGNGVIALTDAAGNAHFCVCGTFKGSCSATIRADGVFLCTVPLKKKCR
jgi:hypothetical protein